MAYNKVNLTDAAINGRNAGAKRKWNVKTNPNQPKENFPNFQRSCNEEWCKDVPGCRNLTVEDCQKVYKRFWCCSADEKFIIQSLTMTWYLDDKEKLKWKYTVPKNGQLIEVCRDNFVGITDLTKSAIGRIQKRLKAGEIFPRKMTGRHDNRPHRISEDFKEAAVQHMLSYSRVNNHYSRGHVHDDTVFLKPPLTITQMYNEFIALYDDDDLVEMKMSEGYFRQIFHSKKIHIGVPLMDTCAVCDTHQNQIDHNRNPRKVEKHRRLKEAHLDKVEAAKRELRSDREKARQNPDQFVVLMIDAQKTLYTPQLTCANAYFGTKYATHNVCINDEGENSPTMYLWNQTTAGIGANEIGSCILKHVMSNYEPLQGNQKRELIIWSDRCKSQNNNWHMLCLFAQLQHLKYFSSVRQKFLITGHSYNTCDANFGLIEKRINIDRVVYPPEFDNVLKSARPNDPFTIVHMTQAMFFSLNELYKYLKKPRSLQVSRHISFHLDKNRPNCIISKKTHDEDCPKEEHFMTFYGRLVEVSQMPLITNFPAYPGGLIPIKDALRADLLKLGRFLPPRAKQWFKAQLRIGQHESDNETESESEVESSDDE